MCKLILSYLGGFGTNSNFWELLKLFLNNFSQRRKICEGGWRFLGIVRNNLFQNRMFKINQLWICRVQTCAETSLYYDMQNQHWMIILILYLTSSHKLWTSSNCVVYSLEGRTFRRPGRWAIRALWYPCPSEVLRYSMKVVQHHLFGLSRLNRNRMAIKLQQYLVEIWER